MESLPGYDAWKTSGYGEGEACKHVCVECEGDGTAWDQEKQVPIKNENCPACDGEGFCDGGCEPDEPDYSWEPEDY